VCGYQGRAGPRFIYPHLFEKGQGLISTGQFPHGRLQVVCRWIQRTHLKPIPIGRFPGMHFIGVDQNQSTGCCPLFAALMSKRLVALFNHTEYIVIVGMAGIAMLNVKCVE